MLEVFELLEYTVDVETLVDLVLLKNSFFCCSVFFTLKKNDLFQMTTFFFTNGAFCTKKYFIILSLVIANIFHYEQIIKIFFYTY